MYEKAKAGGTVSAAKLGYRNIKKNIDGRQVNSIDIDPVRAPLIRKAFELYATGDYTLARLEATMADLGLTAPARGQFPERLVNYKWLQRILEDPYYVGLLVYKGETFNGRHEALIAHELFQRAQDVRSQRSNTGQRERIHHHYLKGMLFCDRCARHERTSRLIYTIVKGRRGGIHEYYLCRGRQEGVCDLPHLPLAHVEDTITLHYRTLRLPDTFIDTVKDALTASLSTEQANIHHLHTKLQQRLKELDTKEGRLIDLAADGTLPQAKIRERLLKIRADRETATTSLIDTTAELQLGHDILMDAVERLREPDHLYARADDPTRRFMNQTFYAAFYLDDHGVQAAHLADDFADLHAVAATSENRKGPRDAGAFQPLSDQADSPDRPLSSLFSGVDSSRYTMVDILSAYSKKAALRDRLRRLDDQLVKSKPRAPRPTPKRRLKQHLTPEQIADLVQRYNAGATSTQLMADTGMSKPTILKLLHANGANMRNRGLSPDDALRATDLYEAGQSLATIGARFNVSAMTVKTALVNQGVGTRSTHDWINHNSPRPHRR